MSGHQGDNQGIERRFIQHINDNYGNLVNTAYTMFNNNKKRKLVFDRDIFQDTIIRCYNNIKAKQKMADESPHGMDCYFLKALYLNHIEKERYAWYKNRSDIDVNFAISSTGEYSDGIYSKLLKDLKEDFSILYIMRQVEQHFDNEHFYLYRLKTLCEMTYKEICNKTKIKGARNKILEVSQWIKENIKKEDVDNEFNELYGNFI